MTSTPENYISTNKMADAPQPTSRPSRKVPRRLAEFESRAVAAGLATHEGFKTICNLVDPFPDDALEPSGWPTSTAESSLPLVLTGFRDIVAPAGTVNSYSMKCMFVPFVYDWQSESIDSWNGSTGVYTAGALGSTEILGHFNVWTWKDTDPEPDCLNVTATYRISLDPNKDDGMVRLCSAGFELINTSTALYRGGYYYAWRSRQYRDNVVATGFAPAVPLIGVVRDRYITGIPVSRNDIINLHTTVTGAATDGVGVFSLPGHYENEPVFTRPTRTFFADQGKIRCNNPVTSNDIYEWDFCGAYVTGLVPQATFQLKGRMFYEIFPTADSSAMTQSLARRPVPYSPVLREMLALILSNMPAGFDYSENPMGEWFHNVLQLLSKAVPAVGSLIPHPAAKVISSAAAPFLERAARATAPQKQHQSNSGSKGESAKPSNPAPNQRSRGHARTTVSQKNKRVPRK